MRKKFILLCLSVVALILFLIMIAASENSEKISKEVFEAIENNTEARVFVIVQDETTGFLFKKTKDSEIVKEEIISEIGEEKIKHDFGNIFSAEINQQDLEKIGKRNGVEKIGLVGIKHIMLQDSVSIINASISQSLQVNNTNLTGRGQGICIIDTGVNYSHASLGGCYGNNNASSSCKVVGGWDVYNSDSDPYDDNGHGTHVSGIVAANGSITGVAPEAKIIMIKAADASGNFPDDALREAIDWCVDNSSRFNISVISMSLGAGLYEGYCDYQDDPFNITLAINNAVAKNISVVVATGNNGVYNSISSPACVQNATPVSATNKNDSIASYANTNALVMLLAPGGDSSGVASREINSTWKNGGYLADSGTSMSTPHVAGAIAIINQYLARTSRTRTALEIEIILNNTGKRIQDTGFSELNFSRINVYNALLSLDITAPNVSLTSPENNAKTTNRSVNFSCLSSDFLLKNISFYLWNSSSLYYSETKNITGTTNNTIFNITNIAFNYYNWSCRAFDNASNSFLAGNFSLSVRRILSSLSSPSNNSYTNLNNTNFTCLAETNNAFNLTNVSFYLFNSTNNLVYNETKNITGISNSTIFNYTLSYQGAYSWNCFSVNNNSNSAFSDSNSSLTYDISLPVVSLISPSDASSYSSSSQLITFEYNVSDNYLIENCSLIISGAVSLTNSSITNLSSSHFFTQTFSPASYSWSVNCSDRAGNIANSSSRSFVVSAPSSPPPGGGGGGGGTTDIPKIYSISTSQINSGYTQSLGENEKISFVLPGKASDSGGGGGSVGSSGSSATSESHSVTINKLTTNYANITVKSNPINLILFVGEEKKLNLTSPLYYDLYLKLNKIESNKVNLTIKAIYEEIKAVSVNQTLNEMITGKDNGKQKVSFEAKVYRVILSVVIAVIIIIVLYLAVKREKIKIKVVKDRNLKKTNEKKKK